jgi:TatD DNase family protein
MIEAIDIGVNLTNRRLLLDIDAVMRRAREAGVEQMVVTGTTIAESRKALELCERYPERLVSTCGVHPHHASDWDQESRAQILELARRDCVRAIGETGLDFNRNFSPPDAQEHALRQQMALAAELQMPLFCHQRDAHARFVEMLGEYRERLDRVVVHCFTDTRAALIDYLDLDCYIGITGWICDERRGLELRQLVKLVPADRLLLETDAPYLLPRNLDPKPANRTNEPAYLPHILREVADCQKRDPQDLARDCLQNSRRFFDLRK